MFMLFYVQTHIMIDPFPPHHEAYMLLADVLYIFIITTGFNDGDTLYSLMVQCFSPDFM